VTLLGRYTVLSAVLSVALAAALGSFVAAQATRAALDEAAATTVQAADSLLSPYLVKGDFIHPLWPARVAHLSRLLRPHLIEHGVQDVRLWSRDAVIVYSNDPARIGMRMETPPEVRSALRGRAIAAIKDDAGRQVLAVFAPVRLVGESAPSGVYEVNLDAAPLLAQIALRRAQAWMFVFLGSALLYLSLIGLVFHASRTMVRQQNALKASFEGIVQALAAAIDAKDSYTANHSAEVAKHAESIARALRLPQKDIDAVRIAGYLHDVGKIGIPDQILLKPGPLNPTEREQVRTHSLVGYRILRPIPVDERVKLAILHNHERWDGAGYPDGLSGSQIPIHARILMVADAYEAMIDKRPYRRALDPMEAVAQLRAEAGRQFDPEVVEAFIRTLRMNGQGPGRGVRGRPLRHPAHLR
jgi:putative nucleotidyltransferase with HDIG domain